MTQHTSRKALADRWSNPDFIAENRWHLEQVFESRKFERKTDLRGISVGNNGPVDFLHNSDFQETFLANVDLSYSSFSCSFIRGGFQDTKFDSSKFDRCSMDEATFERCDFEKTKHTLPRLDRSKFISCNFIAAQIRGRGGVTLYESGQRIKFQECNFSTAKFKLLEIRGVDFIDCIFDDTSFEECMVFNWRFSGAIPHIDQFAKCEFRGKNIGLPDV